MSILLTGGAGYIGSHTAVELIKAGFDVVVVDDLSNSNENVIERIQVISGKKPAFYRLDVKNKSELSKVFKENKIEAVIHFAGFKCVPESTQLPLKYYRNNLDGALTVLEIMEEYSCNVFVFSSSATVYGEQNDVPFNENMPTEVSTNAYGTTKLMIEQILTDAVVANKKLSVVVLRYFNPIGAHPSGLIGEEPNGIPNNLMPYITQVAAGQRNCLNIFGNDYPTPDGTGIRDYIHVVDLARGHVKAVEYALKNNGIEIVNLGTGKGSSVLELVKTFEFINEVKIPYVFMERRPGDVAISYANAEKAKRLLGWESEYSLIEMCRHAWKWQRQNLDSYEEIP